MGNDVFDKSVRSSSPCQIRDHNKSAGCGKNRPHLSDKNGASFNALEPLKYIGRAIVRWLLITVIEVLVEVNQRQQITMFSWTDMQQVVFHLRILPGMIDVRNGPVSGTPALSPAKQLMAQHSARAPSPPKNGMGLQRAPALCPPEAGRLTGCLITRRMPSGANRPVHRGYL